MEFEVAKSKINFKKTLCGILAVVFAFACLQPGFTAFAAYTGINVTDGNVTDGNVTDGNVTDGNVTGGNVCEHDWIVDVTENPSCTEDGAQYYVCSLCGINGDVVILPATGHSVVVDEAVAPTCIETGLTEGSHCSVCNVVIVAQEEITATGHTSSDWIVDKVSTCSESGSKHKECTVCKVILETQTIETLAHAEYKWVVDIESTCTETGKMHKECVDCKAVVEEYVIACKGHIKSTDWVVTKKATVNAAGSKCQKCTVCGETLKTTKIPQLKCATPKLKAVANIKTGVKITWTKVAGADSYTIFRKTGNNNWTAIKGSIKGVSYVDTTAKPGVTYKYTVMAKNEAGSSAYNTIGLTLKRLATPNLPVLTNIKTGVNVKWNKVKGAEGYYVYRKLGDNGKWVKVATVKGNTYKDQNVKSGYHYRYAIKAYSGKSVSGFYDNGIKIVRLATPVLKNVSSAKAGITFKWSKVNGAHGYYVMRKTANGKWVQIANIKNPAKLSYLDKTAKKGKTYQYTVRAYSAKFTSGYNTKGITVKDKF